VASWDIDIAGVQAVLTKTSHHAQSLQDALKSIADDLQSAATASGSPIVGQAVVDWSDKRTADITAAVKRLGSAMNGTVDAVTAYAKGDEQMALTAQRTAAGI